LELMGQLQQADVDLPAIRRRLNAVPDRIFDQRLDGKCRYPLLWNRRRNVPVDLHACAKAETLDLRIAAGQLDFFTEKDLTRTCQSGAEQVGQVQKQALCSLGALVHQCGASVQRIEQEVWLDSCL